MRRMWKLELLAIALLTSGSMTSATIRNVPSDYSSIQQAIEASIDHDTVLVAPGRYYENINFHGRNVVLASHYILSNDPGDILATIIDGSQYVYSDSASTVAMYSGEDSTSAVIGFVITGGEGCIVFNPREGGGVNIDNASTTIKHNIIAGNRATMPTPNNKYRGGGGMNLRNSNSSVISNYIINNIGYDYCGGLLIQVARLTVKNNVIAYNDGGNRLGIWGGGGGIYTYLAQPCTFENNTIAYNYAGRAGGFHAVSGGNSTIRSNIIFDNPNGSIVLTNTGTASVTVTYSDIEGGYSGSNNLDADPIWDTGFLLGVGSPVIDSGYPGIFSNDIEDSGSPGFAAFPSRGTTRNDIGAFGGPGALFVIPLPTLVDPILSFDATQSTFVDDIPSQSHDIAIPVQNGGLAKAVFDSLVNLNSNATVSDMVADDIGLLMGDTITLTWTPSQFSGFIDTLMIYHNDPNLGSPYPFIIDYTLTSCCIGIRGDMDYNQSIEIVDLTYLVDYLFAAGPAAICEEEGNVDGLDDVNIVDLTVLVDYLFAGGPPPADCF